MKQYKALLFDFDGTLFDTHEANFIAYREAYAELGIAITHEQFAKTRGRSVWEFNRILGVECDVEELRKRKAEHYSLIIENCVMNEYLVQILMKAKSNGILTAIVTTARMRNIMPLLNKHRLWKYIDIFVTQEDTEGFCKPNNLCYCLALERLGVRAKDALAFEDDETGIKAARGAGIDTVKVGKFYDDYFQKFHGGSGAKTYLCWNERFSIPVVRKIARGTEAIQKLKEQINYLRSQDDNRLIVNVIEEKVGYDFVYYDMEYIEGVELYKHTDRKKLFEEALYGVMHLTKDLGKPNTEDVRKKLYEMYIVKGVEIYNRITREEKEVPFARHEDIPEFVNNFYCSQCHGDTTLENIMIDRHNRMFFIDPVPKNVVSGMVHDLSKILQSLYGYETIRDVGVCLDSTFIIEKEIFNKVVGNHLSRDEYNSLKFLVAVLFFRRLRYQERQNTSLVKVYGDIAFRLIEEFKNGDYEIH